MLPTVLAINLARDSRTTYSLVLTRVNTSESFSFSPSAFASLLYCSLMVSIRMIPSNVSGTASIAISLLHPAAEVATLLMATGNIILNTTAAPMVKKLP